MFHKSAMEVFFLILFRLKIVRLDHNRNTLLELLLSSDLPKNDLRSLFLTWHVSVQEKELIWMSIFRKNELSRERVWQGRDLRRPKTIPGCSRRWPERPTSGAGSSAAAAAAVGARTWKRSSSASAPAASSLLQLLRHHLFKQKLFSKTVTNLLGRLLGRETVLPCSI